MNNNMILSRVFSQNTLRDSVASQIATPCIQDVVSRYHIRYDGVQTNREIFSQIYQYLDKHYRNEYYYKNTLLNKLIVNVHRLRTTTALTEVPIAKSKADFIMINGKAVVYEIKTELDTFDRLENQIRDYYKAFDYVCVVTSEAQQTELQKKLKDSTVGIYVLTKKNTIRRVKEPECYRDSLDLECIFKIMNKPEYESLVMQLNGNLPQVTQIKYYSECKRIVCDKTTEEVYPAFLRELKKRNQIEIEEYNNVPSALRFLVYFAKYREGDYKDLNRFLNKMYEGG